MMADGGQRGDVRDGGPVRSCSSPARPFILSMPSQAGSRSARPSPAEDRQVVGDHAGSDPALHADRSAVSTPPQSMTALERADAPLAPPAPAQRGAAVPAAPGRALPPGPTVP